MSRAVSKLSDLLFPSRLQVKKKAILDTELFKNISLYALYEIAKEAEVIEYAKDEIIAQEGTLANFFYIILKGEVRISQNDKNNREILLAQISEKGYFGEQALLPDQLQVRSATVTAISNVTLLRINHVKFISLSHKNDIELANAACNKQLVTELLKQIDIFEAIPEDQINLLAGSIMSYKEGDIIFRKNDAPDYMYLIISGRVDIILDENDKSSCITVNEKQIFGELGLLKKQPRSGTAIAVSDSKLLGIKNEIFDNLYLKSTKLRELIGSLSSVYETTKHGLVSTFNGKFEGLDCICATFNLPEGRIALSHQVIGKSIFSISLCHKFENSIVLIHEKKDLLRQLILCNNKLVSIRANGYWGQLSDAVGMLLDNKFIDNENIIYFNQTGNLKKLIVASDEYACNCMGIKKNQIKNAVISGANNINQLCQMTGAGTVCGSCRPKLNVMLGKTSCTLAGIREIIPLSSDINIYRFTLFNNQIIQYQPGQHIVIQALINDDWVERVYTLTSNSTNNTYLEVAIKREPIGLFSNWIFKTLPPDALLRISQPDGDFTLKPNEKKMNVFFAAGIGITPAIAFLRATTDASAHCSLHIDYSLRGNDTSPFVSELLSASRKCNRVSTNIRLTNTSGRITNDDIAAYVKQFRDAEFYICGPDQYNTHIRSALLSLGIHANNIHIELFKHAAGP